MGRYLHHKNSSVEFEANNPSCMWGIFYFLDYHRWYSIKRILPHRKHSRGRHARCWGNPKTVSFGHYPSSEMQGLLDAEIDSYPVRCQDRETIPSSVKADSKTLIHKENSEEDNNEYYSSDSSAELRVESSSLNHYEKDSETVGKKRVRFHERAGSLPVRLQNLSLSKQDKLFASNNVEAEETGTQVMQPVDTLEVFKVKKELFLKVLQDLGYQDRQSLSPKPRLTKSGSFPMPSSEHSRSSKSSTLKHKQSEVWSFPKRRNSLSSIEDLKFAGLKSKRICFENSMPSINEDAKEQEPISSSLGKSKGLVNQGWNQLVINRFKHIKKRIKHVLMESKKERNCTASDALLSRSASSSSEKETAASLDTKDKFESSAEPNSSDYMSTKSTRTSLKRISSLNESLDKYARLLEQGFKKTDMLHQSRSLKSTSENGLLSNKQARKSLRKNLSVADIDLVCLSLFEVPHDVLTPSSSAAKTIGDHPMDNNPGIQNAESRFIEDVNAQNNEPLVSLENLEFKEKLQRPASEEVDNNCEGISNAIDLNKEIVEVQLEESDEQVTMLTLNSGCDNAQTSSDSASGTYFPGSTISRVDYPVLEAPEARNQLDQPEPLIDTQETSTINSRLCPAEEVERVKNAIKDVESNLELDKEDADFRYVKNLLALSGFTAKENQGFWDSEDQPMSTSLFKELEIQVYKKPDCSCKDVDYWHQIMFELVNEVLAELYDTTFTYFPRPFSLYSCVHPWPMGNHLLDEVWKKVSWYLSLRPELDMTLDDVVRRDLSRDDGWMNIKMENECLALQLEDLIFDELLEEVIFSGKC